MIFKKNIPKSDIKTTFIQQFTVTSVLSVYLSVTNWASVNNFVYDKEKSRLHMLSICWSRKV